LSIIIDPHKTNIISISGFISSGKDTVANYLIENCNFQRLSFASALKDVVAVVFRWERPLLEGTSEESRIFRDRVDVWWSQRLGIPNLTPRWVLQQWGTEVCRQGFHNDIWVASLENQILKTGGNLVITDSRFPNEINALRSLGASIVRVRRGSEPDWFDLGQTASSGNGPEHKLAAKQLSEKGIHISEWAWLSTEFDCIIDNDGTFDEFQEKIKATILKAD
jgi:hypothetical protein